MYLWMDLARPHHQLYLLISTAVLLESSGSLRWRHGIHLTRIFHWCYPLDALGSEQLGAGFDVVEDTHIVQDARLDDSHSVFPSEGVAISEQRSAAVGAEATGDLLAGVGDLGNLLWRSLGDLEVGAGQDKVVRVEAARDLSAVGTVAQGLFRVTKSIQMRAEQTGTYHHRWLSRVLHLDIATETATGRHVG